MHRRSRAGRGRELWRERDNREGNSQEVRAEEGEEVCVVCRELACELGGRAVLKEVEGAVD